MLITFFLLSIRQAVIISNLSYSLDGIMRPLSPIRVVETIEPTASVLNPCEIHSATTVAPSATLFVKVDSGQNPVGNTEVG